MNVANPSRRSFLIRAAVLAVAVPFAGTGLVAQAQATALKPLTAENPQAGALKYVADAAQTKEPTFKPGSACANCQFFTAATGACTLFPGFSVSPKGWCSAWAKKA